MKFFSTILFVLFFSQSAQTSELYHPVSGTEVEDVLRDMKVDEASAYIESDSSQGELEINKSSQKSSSSEDYLFNNNLKEVSINSDPRREYKDFGYSVPGSQDRTERQDSFQALDKEKMAKGLRKLSEGAVNLSFVKNDFNFSSTNDVINRTIGNGPKGADGGSLFVRNDSYITRSFLLNTYWSLGGGVGFSSGNGIFVNNTVSDAVFKLWQFPVDLGLGLELPLYNWFKISGTAGASGMMLMQNRSDFERNEKGKRKYQFSPGYFASAQFKINLTGFGSDAAYEAFTTSQITNISMNIEARQVRYANFNDPILISGTSLGIGFTFEYL